MSDKYISIEQFAKEANRSKSAIYQRLKTSLKDYYIERNGIKYINREALNIVLKGVQGEIQGDSRVIQADSRQIQEDIQADSRQIQGDSRVIQGDFSRFEIENLYLRERIVEKDNIIEQLKRELEEARADIRNKDQQLEAQSARLLSITENQQELLRNSQVLQAQSQQKQKGLFARLFLPKEKNKGGE